VNFAITRGRDGKLGKPEAQACLAANLGLPGAGSLMAGRRVGYGQVLLALTGVGLTLVFGLRFMVWFFQNLEQIRAPEVDPFVVLAELWRHLRWALTGMMIFVLAWLWALVTSLDIVRESRRAQARRILP
jgi:hypothetical protein